METTSNFRFGRFTFNAHSGRLFNGDTHQSLQPKDSAVLSCLLVNSHRLVTKSELLDSVWSDTVVEEGVLKASIRRLRKVLSDDYHAPKFIETMHRRGYRFIAKVALDPYPESQTTGNMLESSQPNILVGREVELARLETAWQKARNEKRQVVLIGGEAGIGKSALVKGFKEGIGSTNDSIVVTGQCTHIQGPGEAYGPFFEILNQLDWAVGREMFVQMMALYAPMWLVQLPHLVPTEERERLQNQLKGTSGQRMLREFVTLIDVLSRQKSMVLIIEDLHWADGATLDLWTMMGQRSTPARLLLIGTHRPVQDQDQHLRHMMTELALHPFYEQMELSLFGPDAIDLYLSLRFPAQARPLELAQWLYRYTEGNPLFFIALLAHAEDQGWLSTEGLLIWDEPLEDGISWSVPDNLRELIDLQLQDLSEQTLAYIETAGVSGMSFPTRILCDDPETEEIMVEALLDTLAKGQRVIQRTGTVTWPDNSQSSAYTFIHAWYRQVVYDRIPLLRRQGLHLRLGDRLEKTYGNQSRQIAVMLAMHFELGRDFNRAIEYRLMAGQVALGRHAYGEAKMHTSVGIRLLENLPENNDSVYLELQLRIPLGISKMVTEGYSSQDAFYEHSRAHALCRQAQQTPILLPVLVGLFAYYYEKGEIQEAENITTQICQLTKDNLNSGNHHNPDLELWIAALKSTQQVHQGQFSEGLTSAQQGIDIYRPELHRNVERLNSFDPSVICLNNRAYAQWVLGHPEKAGNEILDDLAESIIEPGPFMTIYILNITAMISTLNHNYTKATQLAGNAVQMSHEHGIDHWLTLSLALQGFLWTKEGRFKKGIRQVEQCIETHKNTGAKLYNTIFLYFLADAYGQIGSFDHARTTIDEALAYVEETKESWFEAELYRLKGDLLQQESLSQAEACYTHALEVARHQKAKSWELRAATSLSSIWTQQGKRLEAHATLAEVFEWFTEGFSTGDLKTAKSLLDCLS